MSLGGGSAHGAVHALARRVLTALGAGAVAELVTCRELYAAVLADLVVFSDYNPEADVRVKFLREGMAVFRFSGCWVVSEDLLFVAAFVCGCAPEPVGHWQEEGAGR